MRATAIILQDSRRRAAGEAVNLQPSFSHFQRVHEKLSRRDEPKQDTRVKSASAIAYTVRLPGWWRWSFPGRRMGPPSLVGYGVNALAGVH